MLREYREGEGITLTVRVMPRSSREGASMFGGGLRVRVAAPPTEGRATRQAMEAVAALFHLSPSQVRCLKGERTREKILLLTGITLSGAQDILSRLGSETNG